MEDERRTDRSLEIEANRYATTLGEDLLKSAAFQVAGFGAGKLMSVLPKSTSQIMTIGDIGSALWDIPAVKTGLIRFFSGLTSAIINDFGR